MLTIRETTTSPLTSLITGQHQLTRRAQASGLVWRIPTTNLCSGLRGACCTSPWNTKACQNRYIHIYIYINICIMYVYECAYIYLYILQRRHVHTMPSQACASPSSTFRASCTPSERLVLHQASQTMLASHRTSQACSRSREQ